MVFNVVNDDCNVDSNVDSFLLDCFDGFTLR